ncbi:nSTAND1 domain-containing NTPase [Streptomyces sp. YIM S03343]
MTPAELREAVIRPTLAAGLLVEGALSARIVEEVADQPGGLPMFSHALLATSRHAAAGS